MDKSNGYENIADIYIRGRGRSLVGIGSSTVHSWAKTLSHGSYILDIGCGTGFPITKIFIDEGLNVYGIDASPTMVKEFNKNFPNVPVLCEGVEDSLFFDRQFDAIIAWGLIFLLPEKLQIELIKKAAKALNPKGKFLFTSPPRPIRWKDAMSDKQSRSLGADKYKELISSSGLLLIEEFKDEGENHYFNSLKN